MQRMEGACYNSFAGKKLRIVCLARVKPLYVCVI